MNFHEKEKKRGSALVICLMVLAILTLLGTTAIINTGTETKITHNTRKSEEAFYAAEAGIEHMLSLPDPEKLQPDDAIVSQALSVGNPPYGPRYRVTILDVVSFDWGVTVFTIESVGYARNEQTRRVLRAGIQIIDEDGLKNRFETGYSG